MYLARFSYDVLPANRQRAIDFIRGEVEAAHRHGLSARLLVPLTMPCLHIGGVPVPSTNTSHHAVNSLR
jgi:hypothetical protein